MRELSYFERASSISSASVTLLWYAGLVDTTAATSSPSFSSGTPTATTSASRSSWYSAFSTVTEACNKMLFHKYQIQHVVNTYDILATSDYEVLDWKEVNSE